MEHGNLKIPPVLTTQRLTLRQVSVSDVHEIFLLRSDTLVNKYLNRKKSKTLQDALEFIEGIHKSSLSYWAIVEKEHEKLIGTICLFDISAALKKCEIGYELLTPYQRKGMMREAAEKVIEYALHTLGLETVEAYTHQDNQSSINLLEELNFKSIDSVEAKNSPLILFRLSTVH